MHSVPISRTIVLRRCLVSPIILSLCSDAETHRKAGAMDNRKLGYRIFLGAAVLVLGGSMLLYLVPQGPASGSDSSDTVAQVGDQSVTVADIREQLSQIEQRNQVPSNRSMRAAFSSSSCFKKRLSTKPNSLASPFRTKKSLTASASSCPPLSTAARPSPWISTPPRCSSASK